MHESLFPLVTMAIGGGSDGGLGLVILLMLLTIEREFLIYLMSVNLAADYVTIILLDCEWCEKTCWNKCQKFLAWFTLMWQLTEKEKMQE